MSKLLDLLKGQLSALTDDESVDWTFLEDAVRYFASYPDQCHHPVENLVYERLERRDPECAHRVNALLSDHDEVGSAAKRLQTIIGEYGNGINADDLLGELGYFLELNRRHMEQEERYFFPAAAAALTPSDWAEIEYILFDQTDPLFDFDTEQRFRSVRERLYERGERDANRAKMVYCIRQLRKIDTIEAFGAAMHEMGVDAALSLHVYGGFELEIDGEPVLNIPDCSESCAIWCAYFFLLGRNGVGEPICMPSP